MPPNPHSLFSKRNALRTLSPQALSEWLHSDQTQPILLDVREPWEFEICHLEGARLIPLSRLSAQSTTLDEDAAIVVICHHGIRSQHAGLFLEQQGFKHIYNLAGGIAQWSREIDPAMPVY